jgi:glycosyltransferase involved in cell wall biosynthesis
MIQRQSLNLEDKCSMSVVNHLPRTIFFYRDFRGFSGGHLKVWDYYNHVSASSHYVPRISFTKESRWDESNPWLGIRGQELKGYPAGQSDVLFLAGFDWLRLTESQRTHSAIPIINLIQGLKHSEPADTRSEFLKHKAIRICVSPQIREAIEASHKVNGPLYVIPNGIDRSLIPAPSHHVDRPVDILVVAVKQPQLGHHLTLCLQRLGLQVKLLTEFLPRYEFLQCLNQAKVTVFLSLYQEGFYLPALEGMAAGTLVVCPDCIGNRSFCINGLNSFVPTYTLENILYAAENALRISPVMIQEMQINAARTVANHELLKERGAFLELLDNIELLW